MKQQLNSVRRTLSCSATFVHCRSFRMEHDGETTIRPEVPARRTHKLPCNVLLECG